MNMTRLLGIILIVVGVVAGLVGGAWLFGNESVQFAAKILGLGILLLVLVAPFVGGGIYLTTLGGKEAVQDAEAAQQRKLLNIVQSKGSVSLNDLVLEMQVPQDKIRDIVQSLVGLGVFNGYINWEKGTIYSSEASKLRELTKCPNCGGEITLGGKGVAKCRFCGTEFFLS